MEPQSRAGEAGEKNGARKSEPARELLIFEFCPSRGVMSAFHKHLITIHVTRNEARRLNPGGILAHSAITDSLELGDP